MQALLCRNTALQALFCVRTAAFATAMDAHSNSTKDTVRRHQAMNVTLAFSTATHLKAGQYNSQYSSASTLVATLAADIACNVPLVT
jgi:hypothetical protein